MSYKIFSIIICLFLGLTTSLNLSSDVNNPILVSPPSNSNFGVQVSIRFSFPSGTINSISPYSQGSSGLNFKQFIGVAFPPSVGNFDLNFDEGLTPKWDCALTDGTNSYSVTSVLPEASPVNPSIIAEKNVAYCRLDDTSSNVPLKTGPSVIYNLTITLNSVKIASTNFLRSVSLFTSTSNNPERIIIDGLPVLGSVALYGDFKIFSPKALEITNSSVIVTQGPSSNIISGSAVYPYNTFNVVLTLKSHSFISAADNVIVFKFPADTVSVATSVSSSNYNYLNPLQTSLKGNISIKSFGTDAIYLDGMGEDLIPDRQFEVTLNGWKALGTNIGITKPISVIVYYKNTYSVLSYSENNIFLVITNALTITSKHPESWDVYRGGAWPIDFTFNSGTDLINGSWIVVQQTNTVDLLNGQGNKVSFIASTCDFSKNDSIFDNAFGKRPNCYPLRSIDNNYAAASSPYNGSGFFFNFKNTLYASKIYKLTIWAFFDACGGVTDSSLDVINSTNSFTVPEFTASIYQTINTNALNENRFTSANNILANSSSTPYVGQCYNNVVFADDAQEFDQWSSTILNRNTISVAGSTSEKGLINYREIYDWVVFSETGDNHNSLASFSLNGPWYQSPSNTLSTTGTKFLYTTGNNSIGNNSFFLAAFTTRVSASQSIYYKTGLPIITTGITDTHPPGRFYWQFPAAWFVAGNNYNGTGTCYASWSITAKDSLNNSITNITGPQLLATVSSISGKFNYSNSSNFFGASTTDSNTSTIDTTRTLLPPNNNQLGKNNIVRLVSTYHQGGTSASSWKIADYSTLTNANYGTLGFNVAFFTSCLKWTSNPPTITSLYTYIDIQIKWNYSGTTSGSLQDGKTISNIRLIKLFPETGVFNDFSKNPTSGISGSSPYISHTIYTANTNDSVCLIELNGSSLANLKDATSNTLVIWIFGGSLLETDYNDASAFYPVAPLASSVKAFGLQAGQAIDNSNPWAHTGANQNPLLSQFKQNNISSSITTGASKSLTWNSSSSYLWFMGSVVYLNSVTSNLTGVTGETTFFIPYYCPRINDQNIFILPTVMAAWITTSSYNSIQSLNAWVTYKENSTGAYNSVKVFGNKFISGIGSNQDVQKTVVAAANIQTATLKWSPYTSNDSFLYVYNGIATTAGTSTVCTGHALFLQSSINIDTSIATNYNAGYNGAIGAFNGSSNFFVLGKIFSRAVYYGLGQTNASSVNNMVGLQSSGSNVASANYYTGIKRPTVDSFLSDGQLVLTDKVAFFCSAVNSNINAGLSNYVNDAANNVRNFILDWYKNTQANWNNASLAFDKTDVYKNDLAGNFRAVISPPTNVPSGTILKFSVNSNTLFNTNSICGYASNIKNITNECAISTLGVVSCPLLTGGSSFTVCCYNINMSDPISLASLTAVFPSDAGISGIGNYLTSEIYNAGVQITSANNPYSFVTNNASATDAVASLKAYIDGVNYSHVNQESGIGKITISVKLPREPTRDMKLIIFGDFTGLLIPKNSPRCSATFRSDLQFGASWDNGDALIDTCSTKGISSNSGTPIVITTKKMIYKCGITFSRSLYISLWPVVAFNFATSTVNKTYRTTLTLNSGDAIALNSFSSGVVANFPMSSSPTLIGQWDSLCAVSVSLKLPGEVADYTFNFDLDTHKILLIGSALNELSIFFPYDYYGSFVPSLMCYYQSKVVNCSFSDEGILNVRFAFNLPVGSGNKISILIVGITNPAIDSDYSFPCTVNTTNFATGLRTNIITGSGSLAGGITTSTVTSSGSLRFLKATPALSDNNPRNVSVNKLRVAFDNAINLTASPVTILNTPVIYIYFPNDYKLSWYTNQPTISIDEYTSDSNNIISLTSTIVPASVVQSGNVLTITLKQSSYAFGTNWRYWDITINNITNPTDTLASLTTRPFYITLTNSNLTSLYKTNTNNQSSVSLAMPVAIDSNIAWTRGNSFVFDNTKWVVDIYADSTQLNALTIKSGRFLKAYFTVKFVSNTLNLAHSVTSLSLSNDIFKTDSINYSLPTAYYSPVQFYVGCPCGTAPGFYVVNFASSQSTTFASLSPIVITVDTFSKGVISFTSYLSVPIASSTWVGILLSEPNFDVININWMTGDVTTNDLSASMSNVIVPSGTLTPSSSSDVLSPVYSVFSITSKSATGPQNFKANEPNTCYSWYGLNTISFNMQGNSANFNTSIQLKSNFLYYNSVADSSILKNSLKFVYNPQVIPTYIYCALACFENAYPSDADIIAKKPEENQCLRSYTNIVATLTPKNIVFSGLKRGQQYKMKCIVQSTDTDLLARRNLTDTLETNLTNGNTTFIDKIATTATEYSQCAKWIFNSNIDTATRTSVVNYCERLYSSSGFFNNGCVICSLYDLSFNVPGLSLPKDVTCTNQSAKSRLRLLQSTIINSYTDTATTLTVCPILGNTCQSDVSFNTKNYLDVLNQLISNLNTPLLFKNNLNLNNIMVNSTAINAFVTDCKAPDMDKFTFKLNYNNTAVTFPTSNNAAWTFSYPTPVNCFWKILNSEVAPSFDDLRNCNNFSWCGNTKVYTSPVIISFDTSRSFAAGAKYQMYIGCMNDIPSAVSLSRVQSVGSFTISATTPIIPSTVTPISTISTNISFSYFTIILIVCFFF